MSQLGHEHENTKLLPSPAEFVRLRSLLLMSDKIVIGLKHDRMHSRFKGQELAPLASRQHQTSVQQPDRSRDTPFTSQRMAHAAHADCRHATGLLLERPVGRDRSPWEAITEACPPIATSFNRLWMPFRTPRYRWPFPFLRSWVSRRSSMPTLRPSWIWQVRNRAMMSL